MSGGEGEGGSGLGVLGRGGDDISKRGRGGKGVSAGFWNYGCFVWRLVFDDSRFGGNGL